MATINHRNDHAAQNSNCNKTQIQAKQKRYFVCMCYVQILHVYDVCVCDSLFVKSIRIVCIFFLPMNLNYAVCNNLICFFLFFVSLSYIIFFSFRCGNSLNSSLTNNVVAHFQNSTTITKIY